MTFNSINGAGTVVGMKNIGAAAANGANAVTATFLGASLAGAADTVKVELNNVGQASNTVAGDAPDLTIQGAAGATSGAETVTLNVSGTAARIGDLVVRNNAATATTTLTKLEVTGDKNLRIDNEVDFAGATGNATVDASKFTGALNINLSSADNVTVTGGTGADRFRFDANLTTADKVVGGEGKDTVAATTAAALVNAGSVLTGVEVAEVTLALAAGDFDVARITGSTINAVSLTAGFANGSSISNLTSGAELTIGAASAGNTLTANIKDATLVANTADTLNINVGTAGSAGFGAGTVTANGVENIVVTSTGAAGTTTALNGGNAGANALNLGANTATSITVKGGVSLSLTSAGNSVTSVDASQATGAVNTNGVGLSTAGASVKGSNKADLLAGAAGKDSIEGGAGNDTINGGAGSDSLTGGDGSDTFGLDLTQAGTANMDTVNDFVLGNGGDVLNLLNTTVTQNGAQISKYLVNSTTQNVPAAATPNVGEAELLILDSSVASLRFADSTKLAEGTFTLTGFAGQKNVLVAYSATAGGDVRLAEVTVNAAGDITAATDITTLKGITTASLDAGFDQTNIALNTAAAPLPTTWTVVAGVNAPVAGTDVQAGTPITFSGSVATLQNALTSVTGPVGQANILSVTGAITGGANTNTLAPAGTANITTLQLFNGANTVVVDARFANVNGDAAADDVTLTAANQAASLGGNADTLRIGTLRPTVAQDGGAGTNTLVVQDGADLALVAFNNFQTLTFDNTGAVGPVDLTMTATQHAQFATINGSASEDRVTFTTAFNGTGSANVESYTFAASTTNVFTVGAATPGTITGSTGGGDTVNINATQLAAVTGGINLGTGTDALNVTTAVGTVLIAPAP